jgi:hypothetical protein
VAEDSVAGVVPRFDSLFGRSGVHVKDPIEDVQAQLFTDSPVDPTPASTDDFLYPVDSAVEVTATRLRTPFLLTVWIRDLDGNVVAECNPNDGTTEVPAGDYTLEIPSLPMKVYARIDDTGFHVIPGEESVDILLDPDTRIRIGARSFHAQPSGTLTTTSDPTDLMDAVSLFGNAMKTWSPERTFPTLRGHPPLLELEAEPDLPDSAAPPDTGIGISVPADHQWLYPVVPLAYWLGATVERGPPALLIEGRRYPLGDSGGYYADTERLAFEGHVRDLLQYSFYLDCAVRTEGFYDVDLDARRDVESADLSLDFERLYDASIADRMRTYAEVTDMFTSVGEELDRPDWRLTADVDPRPQRATTTPFLARDLAVVRCPPEVEVSRSTEPAPANAFTRSTGPGASPSSTDCDVLTRSSSPAGSISEEASREDIVKLPGADSMSRAWVGDGFAVGSAKATTKSYLQRLEKQAEGNSGIEIDVVVNDDEMADEAEVSDIYGTRDHLDFDIDLQQDLTQSELAAVFERDTDFVHYIGHVEPEGFSCCDGHLDAGQLGSVGADTFVLNACSSYEQGQRLVESGAIAGVVTLEDVISSMATKIGRVIARLLNYGFPIGSATNLVQDTMFSGGHYAVVGDSNARLVQSSAGTPNVSEVALTDNGTFELRIKAFATWNWSTGAMFTPYLDVAKTKHVIPGEYGPWQVDESELIDYLDHAVFPVIATDEFYWSNNVSVERLRQDLMEST